MHTTTYRINYKDLLCSTGNYIQHLVMTYNGKESKKEMCVCVSRSVVSDSLRPHRLQPARLLCPWDSPGKNTGVDCHNILQRIFPTQGLNPGLLHCRQILYCLSYREVLKKEIVIFIFIYHFAIHLKLTQHCKAIVYQ